MVNFQMPTGAGVEWASELPGAVCWLHRAGRTGRMGKRGFVTNFVGSKDKAGEMPR